MLYGCSKWFKQWKVKCERNLTDNAYWYSHNNLKGSRTTAILERTYLPNLHFWVPYLSFRGAPQFEGSKHMQGICHMQASRSSCQKQHVFRGYISGTDVTLFWSTHPMGFFWNSRRTKGRVLDLKNTKFWSPSFEFVVCCMWKYVKKQKTEWLVGLYRGWETTQLYRDYNKPLEGSLLLTIQYNGK